jgi:hypothetical protein
LQACRSPTDAAGTWCATGSLHAARYYQAATLLPSGKVLVTGGYNTRARSSGLAPLALVSTREAKGVQASVAASANHNSVGHYRGRVRIPGSGRPDCGRPERGAFRFATTRSIESVKHIRLRAHVPRRHWPPRRAWLICQREGMTRSWHLLRDRARRSGRFSACEQHPIRCRPGGLQRRPSCPQTPLTSHPHHGSGIRGERI